MTERWVSESDVSLEYLGNSRNRPVSPVLTERYELCGNSYCRLDCSDVPGQKLVDATDWMLGDTL